MDFLFAFCVSDCTCRFVSHVDISGWSLESSSLCDSVADRSLEGVWAWCPAGELWFVELWRHHRAHSRHHMGEKTTHTAKGWGTVGKILTAPSQRWPLTSKLRDPQFSQSVLGADDPTDSAFLTTSKLEFRRGCSEENVSQRFTDHYQKCSTDKNPP